MPGISGGVDCNISIHAPTQGATKVSAQSAETSAISIHAPTQGATIASHYGKRWNDNFNPRSHARSDVSKASPILFKLKFQSTLPRKERQVENVFLDEIQSISIHAPTQGATSSSPSFSDVSRISIHAPTQGATIL